MPHEQNSAADAFLDRIQTSASTIVDALRSLTPYERAMALHEAQSILQEIERIAPADVVKRETQEMKDAALTQWMGYVLRRLNPESRATLIGLVQELDDEDRFERLIGDSST